jgi:ribosomal-protein-alanine N-acetyltransferase
MNAATESAHIRIGEVFLDDAGHDDLAAILDLENLVFEPHQRWGRTSWTSQLAGASMATIAGRIPQGPHAAAALVGVITIRLLGDQADLDRLLVAGSARRRGLGHRLLAAGLHAAAARGATEMILEVRRDNRAAAALYDRAGFAVLGSRSDYYGRGSDATLMKRALR